ncbi:hypothetical protein F4776DRAFT_657937 [Hypoxylon sp. NC0597]|nr:hypothetical protein F4776DRAFT_657937 [Hypoxylon sp. NC0597]
METPEMAFERHLKNMYGEKFPFFNRIRLRRLADQIGMHQQGLLKDNKITLKNLLGEDVEVILDPDAPTIWEDTRCNHGDRRNNGPYIYYRSIQKMIEHPDMKHFDARQAYLPFVVMYPDPTNCYHHDANAGPFPNTFIMEELSLIFQKEREKWEECEQHRNLRETLKSRRAALSNVSKIVGFACGPLSYGRNKEDYSLTQHAMILSLRKILTKMKPENAGVRGSIRRLLSKGGEFDAMDNVVRCIVQDPAYTELDKEVLKEEGFIIENDPRGFLAVDDRTVVVSICANTPIQQIICDIARPAAIIQMRVKEGWSDESARHCADPASPRVNKMLDEEYQAVPLGYHPRIRDVVLYVRKKR